jgi:T-complex protein 1 subunit delta
MLAGRSPYWSRAATSWCLLRPSDLCMMHFASSDVLLDRGRKIEGKKSCRVFICVLFRALIAGGGAPETELSLRLSEHAQSVTGVDAYCFRAYADALEIIPLTLAENAGLNSIATVTELRNRHAQGEITAGINVRKVC